MSVLLLAFAVAAMPGAAFASDDTEGIPVAVTPGGGTEVREGTGSLTTLFASNNGFAGNTFDLENIGPMPVTISSFDVNLDNAGSTETITIYYRVGTANGFENSPAGWVVMGTDNAVVSNGDNVPTPVAISGHTINPTELFGMYVDLESFSGATLLRYTNGGPTTVMNTELSLTTFAGKGNPVFTGATFFPRQWNGTVHYDIVPVELMNFSVE